MHFLFSTFQKSQQNSMWSNVVSVQTIHDWSFGWDIYFVTYERNCYNIKFLFFFLKIIHFICPNIHYGVNCFVCTWEIVYLKMDIERMRRRERKWCPGITIPIAKLQCSRAKCLHHPANSRICTGSQAYGQQSKNSLLMSALPRLRPLPTKGRLHLQLFFLNFSFYS